jgi:hypothetical protein
MSFISMEELTCSDCRFKDPKAAMCEVDPDCKPAAILKGGACEAKAI